MVRLASQRNIWKLLELIFYKLHPNLSNKKIMTSRQTERHVSCTGEV